MLKSTFHFFAILFLMQAMAVPNVYGQEKNETICTGSEECGRAGSVLAGGALAAIAMYGLYFFIPDFKLVSPSDVGLVFGTNDLKGIRLNIRSYILQDTPWTLDSSLGLDVFEKKSPATVNYSLGPGARFEIARYVTFSPSVRLAVEHIENFGRYRFGPELTSQIMYEWKESLAYSFTAQARHTEDDAWRVFLSLHSRYSKKNFFDGYVISVGHQQNEFSASRISFVSIGAGF